MHHRTRRTNRSSHPQSPPQRPPLVPPFPDLLRRHHHIILQSMRRWCSSIVGISSTITCLAAPMNAPCEDLQFLNQGMASSQGLRCLSGLFQNQGYVKSNTRKDQSASRHIHQPTLCLSQTIQWIHDCHEVSVAPMQLPQKLFVDVNPLWIILKILAVVHETQVQGVVIVIGVNKEGGVQYKQKCHPLEIKFRIFIPPSPDLTCFINLLPKMV